MHTVVVFPEEIRLGGKIFKRTVFLSSIRYLIVGFSTFGLDYFLNWLLIEVIGVNYLVVGYLVSPVVLAYNFLLHKIWTYKDVGSKEAGTRGQIVRYFILVGFNMLANMIMMYVFYGLLNIRLFPSRVICTGISLAWNFPVQRWWVYRKR